MNAVLYYIVEVRGKRYIVYIAFSSAFWNRFLELLSSSVYYVRSNYLRNVSSKAKVIAVILYILLFESSRLGNIVKCKSSQIGSIASEVYTSE